MSLGVKLSTFSAALILAGSVFADDAVCPDLNRIQAVGISMASELGYGFFVGYSIDNFNTSSTWGFAIGPVQADSDEDAITVSNEILANMTAPGLPDPSEENELVCLYETGRDGVFAIAINNAYALSPMKFKQYLHKVH